MAVLDSGSMKFGGMALLGFLALGSAAQAQDLERSLREESIRQVEEALGQPLPATAPQLLRQNSRLKAAAAPLAVEHPHCLPTCSATDGRFMAIAGPGFGTLSPSELSLAIAVPAGSPSFTVGFFDGDSRDASSASQNWDSGLTSLFDYTLYADPDADGSDLTVVEMAPGFPAILSTAMPDNGWIDYTVATGPEAETPSGNFFYILQIRLLTPVLTLNAFKVRTGAILSGLTLDPVARPFSYIATWTGLTDISTVYPSFPSPTPTTYDGTFRFHFDVPVSQSEMAMWDGDFDRGKFDGTEQDTDDADTPGAPFLPDWSTVDTHPEGVAVGSPGSTGNPADDDQGTGFGAFILRAPSVHYHIDFPSGQPFINDNPSGNLEWEQFKFSTAPYDPSVMDVSTPSIPPGNYRLQIEGVDMLNLNALLLPFRLLCVDEAGEPCEVLRPYLAGEQVYLDQDGDGEQGAGEPGVAGVVMGLYDSYGVQLASTVTDASGRYTFPVEAFTYEVRVEDVSFQPGGPLEGYSPTLPYGNARTQTVPKANLLTFNFGYRGNASLGSRLWNDLDADGIQDAGEPGLAGATVELVDGGGNLVTSTVTSSGGEYSFEHLGPGSYTIRVVGSTLPAGMNPTYDADGLATPYTAAVTLAPDEDRSDLDFGFRKLVALGDRVWNDLDGDGVQDAGEPGINGVTVRLLDGSAGVLATQVTSGDGNYTFTNVPAGVAYSIAVTPPAAMNPTYDVDGVATPNTASVTPTGDLPGVDFGYHSTAPAPGTGTLGYWKNHPEAWPVSQITIGGITYSKSQAISLMGTPGKGDKTYDLFKQLVAAKLNVLIGNNASCIASTITAADSWMASHPVGSKVSGSSSAWSVAKPLHEKLDDYNNGELCAPHRD